jgi:DeoR family fructose operon transcriptional repressor
MFAEERKGKIIELINNRGKIVVPELCDIFGVSASTIRNDLRDLENEHLLTRTHGGAISNTKTSRELLPATKESKMLNQKRSIAREALQLIEDGDTIAITSGTTSGELIKLLPQRKNLTVVLNDIHFASWLEENTDYTIFILGGFVRNKYHSIISPIKSELLGRLNIDKAFVSCNGVTLRNGVTTPNLDNALGIQQVLTSSCEIYVLSDSSKIGTVTFAKISDLQSITALITDDGIEKEDVDSFQSVTNVIVASSQSHDDSDKESQPCDSY